MVPSLESLAAAVIMEVIYGHDVSPTHDHFVDLVETAIAASSAGLMPGAYLVNIFPLLQYVPTWFPGAGFHRFAQKVRVMTREMQDGPFNFVRKNMVRFVLTSWDAGSFVTCLGCWYREAVPPCRTSCR